MVDLVPWIINHADWLGILLIISIFTIITIRYYTKHDDYEKEPKLRLILSFFFGLLSVIPSIILSIALIEIFPSLDSTVFIAPFAEEIGKGLFVIWLSRSKEFDGPLDGLIYGGLVGAGFAAAENVLYAISALTESGVVSGIINASFRSIFQIVGHPFFTGLFGYSVGRAKVGLGRFKWGGIWKAMLAHGIWNYSASLSGLSSLGVIILLGLVYLWYLKRQFSHGRALDEDAYDRGYYEKGSEIPYIN